LQRRTHTHRHLYIHVYIHIFQRQVLIAKTHTHTHTLIHTCIYTHILTTGSHCKDAHTHTYTYTYMYIYTYANDRFSLQRRNHHHQDCSNPLMQQRRTSRVIFLKSRLYSHFTYNIQHRSCSLQISTPEEHFYGVIALKSTL